MLLLYGTLNHQTALIEFEYIGHQNSPDPQKIYICPKLRNSVLQMFVDIEIT